MAKRRASDDVGIVVRNWVYVPSRLQQAMIRVAEAYAPVEVEDRFPTPSRATWEDVDIVLLAPKTVRISVRRVTRTYSFAQIGLADRRRPTLPRLEWRMLRTYAENPEPDAYYRLPKRRNLKVEISMFRRWLKKFFGIAGDPLKPFKPMLWLPRFQIRALDAK